jgi:hypothetical protein
MTGADELRLLLDDLRRYTNQAPTAPSVEALLADLGHLRGLLARVTTSAVAHARDTGLDLDHIADALGLPTHDPSRTRGVEGGWSR